MADIIAKNAVKAAIAKGEVVTGCFVAELRQPTVATLLKLGGLDFFLIDNEHGQWTCDRIAEVCTQARHAGITPFVRVPDYSYAQIAQSLDAGAQGLIFPRIETAAQCREIIQIARYPPAGKRGNATNRVYCDFRVGPVMEAMAEHNAQTLLIFQVETKECLDSLDDILSLDGVDGVLVGPNDLSISLGVPGQVTGDVMVKAFQRVLDKCKEHKVIPGCHINDTNLAGEWAAKGYRFVSSSADTMMLQVGAQMVNQTIKKACGQK